jgi:hypothetical protein
MTISDFFGEYFIILFLIYLIMSVFDGFGLLRDVFFITNRRMR